MLAQMAADDPQTSGLMISDRNGDQRANPLLRVVRQAADQMLVAARELGCTPVARAHLANGVGARPPHGGKFDGLLA
jgi:P27 family predicted phage terminase small subunit